VFRTAVDFRPELNAALHAQALVLALQTGVFQPSNPHRHAGLRQARSLEAAIPTSSAICLAGRPAVRQ
jgi:hypothetical protein